MVTICDGLRHFYSGKRVLITGDTGFKGSWLALWLKKLGADVFGLGLPPNSFIDNYHLCGLSDIISHQNIEIRNYNEVLEFIGRIKPDIIFHLAAQALVSASYINPRETCEVNIMGTVNILEVIRQIPTIKTSIFVTSDKCYDNKEWHHGYRECDPLGGRDPYSASKGATEIIIQAYQKSFFSQDSSPVIASVRAGNVIGGGDRARDRIIPDCIHSLECGEPLIIRSPNAIRPWQHVLEPLSGYLILAWRAYTEGNRFNGAWNFGPKYSSIIPVRELIEKIFYITGKGDYEVVGSPDLCEASILMLDISKSVLNLQWHPILSIDDALIWTIQEYQVESSDVTTILSNRISHISWYEQKMEAEYPEFL